MCSKALELIKFLGTLQMKKLELKHDPKLRRASFLEWISQLEVAFSSNLYAKDIMSRYSTRNKINSTKDILVDNLVYTVAYAFMDKVTRDTRQKYDFFRFYPTVPVLGRYCIFR